MVSCTNSMCIGMEVSASGSRLMPIAWYKTKQRRYFRLKFGTLPNLITSRKKTLSPNALPYSSTNAISEWRKMRKRWGLTMSSARMCCRASWQMDTTVSKLWPFKNILTMVLSAITFQVSLLPLHASALPKN